MKRLRSSEKIVIEDVMKSSKNMLLATRGLPIGALIKSIRIQLGMPQQALAKRAGIPQSTVSRIEKGGKDVALSTLHKILSAMSCDLIIAPLMEHSIDTIRQIQARKIAEKRVRYLKGTMNLENQQPDPRFMEELLKEETERLLQGPNYQLWEE